MSLCSEATADTTAAAFDDVMRAQAEPMPADAGAQHIEVEVMSVDDVWAFWSRMRTSKAA